MRLPALELPAKWPDLPRKANWAESEEAYQALGVPRSWLILAPQPDRGFRLFLRKTPLAPEKTDNWRNLLQDPKFLPTLWTRPEEEEPGEGRVEAGRILDWDKPGLTFARTEIVWPIDGRARIWFWCRERGVLFLNNRKLLELDRPTRAPRCVKVDLKRGRAVFKVKLGTQGGPWGFSFRVERDDPDYRVSLLRTLSRWHPDAADSDRVPRVRLEIARCLEEAGRKEEALAAFRETRGTFPLDEEVRVEASEAERRLQAPGALPPVAKSWAETHDAVSVLLSRGEAAAADAALRLFVARYPSTAESTAALLRRGGIRKAWGLRQEGLGFYLRAMRQDPQHPEVIRQALPVLDHAYRHDEPPYAAETTPDLPPLLEAARRQLHSGTTGDVSRAARNLDKAWLIGAHLFLPARYLQAPLRHIGTALAIRQLAEQLDEPTLLAYGAGVEVPAQTRTRGLQAEADPSALIRRAARHPLTPSAIETLNQASNRFMDQGRWREAAAVLAQLVRDAGHLQLDEVRVMAEAKRAHALTALGEWEQALRCLRIMRTQLGNRKFTFHGETIEAHAFARQREEILLEAILSARETPPLFRLTTLNGNAARTGLPMDVPPDNVRLAWRAALPRSPAHLRACERAGMVAPLPRFPLVADNRVFVAQTEALCAFDIRNGRLLWQVRHAPADPVPAGVFGGLPVCSPSFSKGHLFLRVAEGAGTELRAYSAGEGRLRWRSNIHPDLRDLLWLGDPAVDGGSVYAVFIEHVPNGPARHGVACLDERTGALRWKRYVLSGSAGWRVGGAHWLLSLNQGPPAVANGVVYAATGLRSVVALDAFTGLPLWLTAYPSPASGIVTRNGDFLPCLRHQLRRGPAILQVQRETVFHAPTDAPGLLALDARTGELKWKRDLCDASHLLRGFQTGLCAVGYSVEQLDMNDGSTCERDAIPGTMQGVPAAAGPRIYVAAREKLLILTYTECCSLRATLGSQRSNPPLPALPWF